MKLYDRSGVSDMINIQHIVHSRSDYHYSYLFPSLPPFLCFSLSLPPSVSLSASLFLSLCFPPSASLSLPLLPPPHPTPISPCFFPSLPPQALSRSQSKACCSQAWFLWAGTSFAIIQSRRSQQGRTEGQLHVPFSPVGIRVS